MKKKGLKTMSSVMTRRDRCYLIARRMRRLSLTQAGFAWHHLAEHIERKPKSVLGWATIPPRQWNRSSKPKMSPTGDG